MRTIVSRFASTCLSGGDGKPYVPDDRLKHVIRMRRNYVPPSKVSRPYSTRMQKLVDETMVKMWQADWIRPLEPGEYGEFESPVLMAKHPSNPDKPLRPTADFRPLNSCTEPMKLWEAAPQVLHLSIPPDSYYISAVDGRKAYYNQALDRESQRYTSFT